MRDSFINISFIRDRKKIFQKNKRKRSRKFSSIRWISHSIIEFSNQWKLGLWKVKGKKNKTTSKSGLEIVRAWNSLEQRLAGKIHSWIVLNFYLCGLDFKGLSILGEEEECMYVGREWKWWRWIYVLLVVGNVKKLRVYA